MNLKQYYKQLKIAEKFAKENNYLAVRNTLWNWFEIIQNDSSLIDEKGLLLLLESANQLIYNEKEIENSINIYEFILKINPNNEVVKNNLDKLKNLSNLDYPDCLKFADIRNDLLSKCRNKNINSKYPQVENNNRKFFPYLVRSKDDLAERPKILLQPPCVRSGSLFFHSLIDGHPEISTLPTAIMSTFFETGVWTKIKVNFNKQNWQETLISNFLNVYSILFNCGEQHKIPTYENAPNYGDYLKNHLGLYEPDFQKENECGYFAINKEKFISYLRNYLSNKKYINKAVFFDLLHAAYQYSLNRPINTKFDFYHIHFPSNNALAECIYSYKNIRLLSIIREPIQALESLIKRLLYKEMGFSLLEIYSISLGQLGVLSSVFNNFNLFNNTLPSKVIRLEDLKRNTDNTLNALCNWFGVNYSDTLKVETFGNRSHKSTSQSNVSGLNTENIDRKIGSLYSNKPDFTQRDYRILKILSYPLSVKYKYIEKDSLYIQNEIKYLKNELTKNENYLFDFEFDLQSKLKAQGINEQIILNIHQNFRKNLKPFLQQLENYETYSGLAELLEI